MFNLRYYIDGDGEGLCQSIQSFCKNKKKMMAEAELKLKIEIYTYTYYTHKCALRVLYMYVHVYISNDGEVLYVDVYTCTCR